MRKVMVSPIGRGAALVSVPILLNGEPLQCVFFSAARGLSLVGIFDAKPRDVGPFWIFEAYTRRTVPASVIRDARERALDALAALDTEPQTEREPPMGFASDVVH